MALYRFRYKKTGVIFTELMCYAEKTKYLRENKNTVEAVIDAPALISDRIIYRKKVSGDHRNFMEKMAKDYPDCDIPIP